MNRFVRILSITAMILIGLGFTARSQVRTITGKISAADTKETLPGTTVVVKGTTEGTISDINGKYSIQVSSEKDVLIFSFVGYESQEVEVKKQSTVNIVLEVKKTLLDEVVVIGYGSIKKSDLSGSVGSVKSKDITKITSLNPVQSLQGVVTGVQVTSVSGTPGEKPAVKIRGVGTFNNTQPIYVVDGVIVDDISFLNASDISSMEVLKDASASAIYGSRGANGVIMVTTKIGKSTDERTNYTFSSEYGIQRLSKKIDLLNGRDFAIISNRIKEGSYNNVDAVPNTDWQDEVFHTAPVQNIQMSATGASKNMQYYIGGSYFNQKGIIDKSDFERFTLKVNNIYNFSKYIRLGNNLTLAPFSQQVAPNVTYQVYRARPTLVPYYDDGTFAVVYNVGNPLADLEYSNSFVKGLRGVGNMYLEANVTSWATFKSSFGADVNYNQGKSFTPAYTIYNPDGTISQQQNLLSRLNKSYYQDFTWLWENTMTFNKSFDKHSFNGLVGYTMQKTTSNSVRLAGSNLLRDGNNFWYVLPPYVYDPNNNVNNIDKIIEEVDMNNYYSMISYLARLNYVYAGKYILTATFRSDGSSKFAKDNRFATFPSFAAGWNIHEEQFLKNQKLIDKLKFRVSYGKLGNDKIPYVDRYARVSTGIVTIFGTADDPNTGATYGLIGNPDLKWEVTTQTDVGIEASVLNGRLTGEFDFYNKQTDDILVLLAIPGYLGNGQGQMVRFNAGSVVNRGIEFNIGWRDKWGKIKYNVSFLGTTVHNEVLTIGGGSGIDSLLLGGYLGNGIPVTCSRVGLPIGAFYGYQTDGIFQNAAELAAYPHLSEAGVGDLRFVDVNGDNKIDGLDRTYIGSPVPKFIFGFNAGIEYNNFDFSVNIQGQTGNKIFNAKEVVRPDPYNFESKVMDSWNGEGSSNSIPRPSFGGYNYIPSDYFIQDGSFLRLRNVILGYSLPYKWCTKVHMNNVRLYVKADNVFTITKFTGYTPEIGSSSVLTSGIDFGAYPITALYSFGINLNF
ncbi:MAG: SusC/RagA family TonB-linked outer membrane protein [Bacteroidales bacterium]